MPSLCAHAWLSAVWRQAAAGHPVVGPASVLCSSVRSCSLPVGCCELGTWAALVFLGAALKIGKAEVILAPSGRPASLGHPQVPRYLGAWAALAEHLLSSFQPRTVLQMHVRDRKGKGCCSFCGATGPPDALGGKPPLSPRQGRIARLRVLPVPCLGAVGVCQALGL